ncbi:hypothetical protein [Thermoanaerobacter sp. RKWS2]|uniref:hypothetical protein n=1 Tax=Thermoanaerobacter sp. RKWS2 TaxID=2983842 RepID=UPI00224AA01B|nr:hypothetical protein [Thermoanaerobacter sp. RKWS2]UZQ81834.1 hypothetical protein OEI98_001573 [Thermoanaerobacter sp. RKWS2]
MSLKYTHLYITWNGDLSNTKLKIKMSGAFYPGGSPEYAILNVLDANNNSLRFEYIYNGTSTIVDSVKVGDFVYNSSNYTWTTIPRTFEIVIPPRAVKLDILGCSHGAKIYEIQVVNN